jgi:hypothetical protein
MGLTSGHTTNFVIENLTLDAIISLAKHRKLFRRLHEHGVPVVDIDASWVIRKHTNISFDMRITQLMRLSMVFIKNGCRVNIVFDGINRHHSKRSTTKRYVDGNRSKIEYQVGRGTLSTLNAELKRANTEVESNHLTLEIAKVKKKIKAMERKMSESFIDVGEKLVQKVKQQINQMCNDHYENLNQILTCMVAEYQADSVIAYRTVNQFNDLVQIR